MVKSTCFVEIDPLTEKIIRIFKTTHKALSYPQEIVKQSLKPYAVGEIRKQVVTRATVDGIVKCQWCSRSLPGEYLEWGEKGEMHEVVFRGKGGEVSLDNSVMICINCHRNDAHSDRQWQTAKK